MLDIKNIRSNPEKFKINLKKRDGKYPVLIDDLLQHDRKRREILTEVEELKSEKNSVSKLVGELKRNGDDATEFIKKTSDINEKIAKLDEEVKYCDSKIYDALVMLPNIVNDQVVEGKDETDNVVIREVGKKPNFNFEPKPHFELGESLDILDFESSSKIAGSRFVTLKKDAARLERALINFMLNLHVEEHGCTEIQPPYFVNRNTMTKAGKLPKFEDDAFKIFSNTDLFLNSTAEIPLIGHLSDNVISYDDLPINFAAYTTAFRKESGSAGRDTRGLMRLHQFNKVELLTVSHPSDSYKDLEIMLNRAEKVLQLLELPYRVVCLCTGDLGDGNAITFDLEVWVPSVNKYREISSVSNAESFQAIRGNIKYRDESGKLDFVHILNGSGLAVGRTMLAVLENYQNEDGSITVPKVLVPYMGKELIK